MRNSPKTQAWIFLKSPFVLKVPHLTISFSFSFYATSQYHSTSSAKPRPLQSKLLDRWISSFAGKCCVVICTQNWTKRRGMKLQWSPEFMEPICEGGITSSQRCYKPVSECCVLQCMFLTTWAIQQMTPREETVTKRRIIGSPAVHGRTADEGNESVRITFKTWMLSMSLGALQ